MLLTISTTHSPATDLGYLLHKNPARLQSEEMSFGNAHVFYPEADCRALHRRSAAWRSIRSALVRGRRGPAGEGGQLQQYVNDRPYTANSFLSVALGEMFSTAMGGRSKERQELADTAIPLTASLPVVASRGGVGLLEKLFEPLGYSCESPRGVRSTSSSPSGVRRPTSPSKSPRRPAFKTCSPICTCLFPCSTMKSTIGLARTRSRSC